MPVTDLYFSVERTGKFQAPIYLAHRAVLPGQFSLRADGDAVSHRVNMRHKMRFLEPSEVEPFSLADGKSRVARMCAQHLACGIDDLSLLQALPV